MSCENPPSTGESSISVIELNVGPVFKKVVIQNEMDEMHRARGHIRIVQFVREQKGFLNTDGNRTAQTLLSWQLISFFGKRSSS